MLSDENLCEKEGTNSPSPVSGTFRQHDKSTKNSCTRYMVFVVVFGISTPRGLSVLQAVFFSSLSQRRRLAQNTTVPKMKTAAETQRMMVNFFSFSVLLKRVRKDFVFLLSTSLKILSCRTLLVIFISEPKRCAWKRAQRYGFGLSTKLLTGRRVGLTLKNVIVRSH